MTIARTMFRRILPSRSRAAAAAAEAALPAGHRVYAIGDIHGRRDLLDMLLDRIDADDATRGRATTQYVFLGDLIDRGPDSAGVVERLRLLSRDRPDCRFLLGNHEEVMLKALEGDLAALAFFNRIGGRETILSYGVSADAYLGADYPELLDLFRAAVPPAHVAFLESFDDMIVLGDYAFVHAGIRPDALLAEQRVTDLRWIRHEFLSHKGPLEKMIVHGHTISEEVEMMPHRIGLDTGAYASGKLSAMGFEGAARWPIQASI